MTSWTVPSSSRRDLRFESLRNNHCSWFSAVFTRPTKPSSLLFCSCLTHPIKWNIIEWKSVSFDRLFRLWSLRFIEQGCLHVLLGNDSFFFPSKLSWPLLEKLCPSLARTKHATKASTQGLIEQIVSKITQQFHPPSIIEETNDIAAHAAAALWRPLDSSEVETDDRQRDKRNEANAQAYRNLMETLNRSLHNDRLQVFAGRKRCLSLVQHLEAGVSKRPRSFWWVTSFKSAYLFLRWAFEPRLIFSFMTVQNCDWWVLRVSPGKSKIETNSLKWILSDFLSPWISWQEIDWQIIC